MDEQEQAQRDALELEAIPLCAMWREQHPEEFDNGPEGGGTYLADAPYCCSAYCPRCQGLRMLDGERILEPNEWMHHD